MTRAFLADRDSEAAFAAPRTSRTERGVPPVHGRTLRVVWTARSGIWLSVLLALSLSLAPMRCRAASAWPPQHVNRAQRPLEPVAPPGPEGRLSGYHEEPRYVV